MKPKSKKDQYTVECENRDQTIKVLNYIDKNNDLDYVHWKYVTNYKGSNGIHYSEINDSLKYPYPVISFEEWKNLPYEEFTLPDKWSIELNEKTLEFCNNYRQKIDTKNIIWGNDRLIGYMDHTGWWSELNEYKIITFEQFREHVLGEKEIELKTVPVSELEEINPPFAIKINDNDEIHRSLTEPKKIIGYKLIKPEYEAAAVVIVPNSEHFQIDSYGLSFETDTKCEDLLRKAGVLDLWFQPVYESSTEQKIIDYLSKKVKLTQEEAEDIVKLVNEK